MSQSSLMLQFSRKIALKSPAQFNRVKGLVVLYLIEPLFFKLLLDYRSNIVYLIECVLLFYT